MTVMGFTALANNSDTTERLHNEHRLKYERHQEYLRVSLGWLPLEYDGLGCVASFNCWVLLLQAREQEELPSWSRPKCGKENLGFHEHCMTVVGVKRPLMEQRGSSWVYSRKVDEENVIHCGQPRPAAFRPTLLLAGNAPPQRYALDVFSDLYSKRYSLLIDRHVNKHLNSNDWITDVR